MQRFRLGCCIQQGARLREVCCPVHAQHVAIEHLHVSQPLPATFGKDYARHGLAVCACALQLREHAAGVGQAEGLKRAIGKHAAPAIKHHNALCASLYLGIQAGGYRIGINSQYAVQQIGAAVEHVLDGAVVSTACAFNHVASQRPGAARKANQGHAALQGVAGAAYRIKNVAQLLHIRHSQPRNGGFITHWAGKDGAFTVHKIQPQPHRVWNNQNIAKYDRRIQRVTRKRLQGNFGGVAGIARQRHKAARFGAGGAVFRQIAPRLAHEPDRRVAGGQPQAGTQKTVVLQRCKAVWLCCVGARGAGCVRGHTQRALRLRKSRRKNTEKNEYRATEHAE